MADSSPSGTTAFSAWLSQVSDAIKDSFLSLGPKPTSTTEPDHAEVPAESGSNLDASSMDPNERLQALQAQLAMRGMGIQSEARPSEPLMPISEEAEELESKRGDSGSHRCSTGEISSS